MNEETAPKNEENKGKNSFWEFVRYAVIALVIVVPFRIFIAQPYMVYGSSMDPTFKDSDYLIVDQISKRFEDPKRDQVLIIIYPKDTSKFFIKRLIGLPGDTVEIKNGEVTIYNKENKDGLKLNEPYIVYGKDENFSTTLKEDEYFVMGDNRAGSFDSRYWGPLSKNYIMGRPFIRLYPFNKIGVWPGMDEINQK